MQASLTKTDAENYVFKGTEQRVKKVPFQYHFITQEYHLVPFLSGFHYPEVSAEYGNETLSINGLRGQISNKTILHRADTSSTIKKYQAAHCAAFIFYGGKEACQGIASCTARCASYFAALPQNAS